MIYTRKDIGELLNISDKPVTQAFRELSETKLIYEKRQGLGKANLIFVGKIDYNFTESENVRRSNTNISNTKNNNIESQSVSSELEEIKNKCELELFEETDNQGMTNFGIRNMIENAIEIIFIQKT